MTEQITTSAEGLTAALAAAGVSGDVSTLMRSLTRLTVTPDALRSALGEAGFTGDIDAVVQALTPAPEPAPRGAKGGAEAERRFQGKRGVGGGGAAEAQKRFGSEAAEQANIAGHRAQALTLQGR